MSCTCYFCHRRVILFLFPIHVRKHTKLLRDGQMTNHVTARPDDRYQGSLDGVPQVYRHAKCHQITGMPEKIVRSYLVNPMLYSDETFCTGCHTYVPHCEVAWVDTGQTLAEYFEQLRQEFRRARPDGPDA